MKEIYLQIGGFVIQMCFIRDEETLIFVDYFYALIKHYYKNFIIERKPLQIDYVVEVTYHKKFQILQKRNQKEIFINFYKQIRKRKIRTYYHISAMQLEIIIRNIVQELLLAHEGFLIHGSGIKIKNRAYLFLGASGAGKSTLAKLLSPQGIPIADDTLILRRENKNYFCYSTATVEKNFWVHKNAQRIPLEKIFFIQKAAIDKVSSVRDKEEIIHLMSKQIFSEYGYTHKNFPHIITFVNDFHEFYYLYFSLKKPKKLMAFILE